MTRLFLQVLRMSLTASFVIGVVLLLRALLCRAPKLFSYGLWALVFFRLLCPLALESELSLLRPQQVWEQRASLVLTGGEAAVPEPAPPIPQMGEGVESPLPQRADGTDAPAPPIEEQAIRPLDIAALVWAGGVLLLLGQGMWSYLHLSRRLAAAVRVEEGVFASDRIGTPFVLGLIRPRIYLPLALVDDVGTAAILLHERTHLRRGDPVWKLLAWLAVAVHWFNPLVWLSFRLMVRDMEMSCDESVLRRTEADIRDSYSRSLLALAAHQSGLTLPLAFGEENVKQRVRHVLDYHRPAFWVVLAAALALATAAVGLLTNPKSAGMTDYARTLIEHKVAYVGDAPQVVSLVDLLPKPDGVVRGEVELQTAEQPYGLTVQYHQEAEAPDDWLETTAVLSLSLIDNADWVELVINDVPRTYTRQSLEETYGDLRAYALDAKTLEPLLERLGVLPDGRYFDLQGALEQARVFTYDPSKAEQTEKAGLLEQVGMQAISHYYGAFSGEEIPPTYRITSFSYGGVALEAGDETEFLVSAVVNYTTAGSYFRSANGSMEQVGDGWRVANSRVEFRIRSLGDGRYEIVEVGTGGGGQGLADAGRRVQVATVMEGAAGDRLWVESLRAGGRDTLELLAAMERMQGFTITEAMASYGYLALQFPGQQPEAVYLRLVSESDWQQEYPIDSATGQFKIPPQPGHYFFFADLTWPDGPQETVCIPVVVLQGDDASGTVLADDTALWEGRAYGVRLALTSGTYFDVFSVDYAPSAYVYPTNFTGQYQLELYDGSDPERTLSTLPLPFDGTVNFSGRFSLAFADYNGDGRPDFSIGQPVSSSTMEYRLYTVDQQGRLSELPVEGGAIYSANEGFSAAFKQEGRALLTQVWDNAVGEYRSHTYTWEETAGRFVDTGPVDGPQQQEVSVLVEQALDRLTAPMLASSDPQDYIDADWEAYESVLKYGGDEAADYLLDQFAAGRLGDDLRGQLAMRLCFELLGPRATVAPGERTPTQWHQALKVRTLVPLQNFIYDGDDPQLALLHRAEQQEDVYSSTNQFFMVAPHLVRAVEEGDYLKLFAVVEHGYFRLYQAQGDGGDVVQQVTSWTRPEAFTFRREGDGWTLEQKDVAQDGSGYGPSIRAFCTMPVSGMVIEGLAESLIGWTGTELEQSEQTLRHNLAEHLISQGWTDVSLWREDGSLEPLG